MKKVIVTFIAIVALLSTCVLLLIITGCGDRRTETIPYRQEVFDYMTLPLDLFMEIKRDF